MFRYPGCHPQGVIEQGIKAHRVELGNALPVLEYLQGKNYEVYKKLQDTDITVL